jgi:hypothetical protein
MRHKCFVRCFPPVDLSFSLSASGIKGWRYSNTPDNAVHTQALSRERRRTIGAIRPQLRKNRASPASPPSTCRIPCPVIVGWQGLDHGGGPSPALGSRAFWRGSWRSRVLSRLCHRSTRLSRPSATPLCLSVKTAPRRAAVILPRPAITCLAHAVCCAFRPTAREDWRFSPRLHSFSPLSPSRGQHLPLRGG